MATATLPRPSSVINPTVSPIVSQAEILLAVANGTMSVEQAAPLLASTIPPARPAAPKRVTPKDPRPYRKTRNDKGIEKLYCCWKRPVKGSGAAGALTTTPEDWRALIEAAQAGVFNSMLADHAAGTVQWSESYAQNHPEVIGKGGAA